jgi:hypothetical protein
VGVSNCYPAKEYSGFMKITLFLVLVGNLT